MVKVPVVFTRPPPDSVIEPEAPSALRFTAWPPAAEIAPVTLSAPVLLTVTVPPVSVMPVIVSGLAVLVSATLPLVVLVALKVLTAFAWPSVVPVAEEVVSVPPVDTVPIVSVTDPVPEVRFTAPEVEVRAWPMVTPDEPTSVMLPLLVVSAPLVASAPPLLRKSRLPVPLLRD